MRVERRSTQRFDLNLPLTIRVKERNVEGCGVTQNLSARGALLYTDLSLCEGETIELILRMPSEITLTEAMRVCCRGKVVRLLTPAAGMARAVAVQVEEYEYLQETADESSATLGRIFALHEHRQDEEGGATPHLSRS